MATIVSKLVKLSAAALLLASGAAGAVEALSGQYTLAASATHVSGSTYTFDYAVTNNNQTAGGQTGFDGLTIFVPDSALFVGSTHPQPFVGTEFNPGYWSEGAAPSLNLLGDHSQDLTAPAGYHAYTWWGQYTESVYQVGSTAHFSITLSNVAVGDNTIGMSSYFGYSVPNQNYAANQWGNYTTFATSDVSPMAAVPEPETYAMLFAGLGLIGFMARRRKA